MPLVKSPFVGRRKHGALIGLRARPPQIKSNSRGNTSDAPFCSLPPSDRLPRGEEQRAEPRRDPQVVRHRREGPRGEAGATAAAQEVFPDVPTAVTTGKQGFTVYGIKAD